MNVGNWLSVFIVSLLAIAALGYGANRLTRRATGLWNVMSLAFAGLICATIVATLSPYAPTITTAARAAAAQPLTCVGTPPLVRAGDEIAITGMAPADSAITLSQGDDTLATATADASGAFVATITLSVSGLQNVNCQVAAGGQTNTIVLSFLVIGQAAAPEPLPTNTPEPTATNTTEPTATETPAPAVAPPVVDPASIPAQLLPGDTFRLRGTAEGGARVRVAVNNRVVAGAVAGPQGSWRTTVGFARSGEYTLTVQLVQDDAVVAEAEPIFLTVLEPTPTPEPTATNTAEPTATNTAEPTATNTPEPTATNTPEPTATNTPTPAAPVVDTESIPEQLLPGDTFRLRGTAEGGARVRVAVNSRVVAGAVAGPQGSWRTTVGFARSGEYTLTVQLVQDDTVVAEAEPIFLTVLEPTPTATNTPEPTATNTPEPTATNTPEPTATNTPEPTATDTPEPTATNTPEPTVTDTPEPTATNTPEPTATDTPEPTATNTPEPTATNTPEPTPTDTPEPTATNTPTAAPPVVDMASIPEQLLPGDTFRLRGTTDGGAHVRVAVNDRIVAGAVAGPQGTWRTTVGFARSGEYTLTVQLVQEDVVVAEAEPIFLTVLEPTPTATNTPEPTATNTPEPTATNTPEPTATNTPEPTATNTLAPTATPVPTPTNTPEPTATNTPEPTVTNTPEPTATNTPTPAAPVVDTASIPDQLLPGDTFRLRGTADGGARVRVAVNNRVVAGAVAGPQGSWRTTVGFARSGEYTLTVQLVQEDVVVVEAEPIFLTVLEPTPTPEPTATNTPEPTATNTPEPTATNTPEPTATNTPEPTATNTPEPTATNTPEPTATNTPEPTATNTPEPTATNTPEPTATNTPEPTATNTPEPTATNTPEPTATNTPAPVAPVIDTASIPEQLLPGDTFRLRGTADSGARVRVAVNNRVVAGAVAGPQGTWRMTVGFAAAGAYTLTVQLVQDDVAVAVSAPLFLTVIAPTPTAEPTPTAVLEPTPTTAAVDASQPITSAAPVAAAPPVTDTVAAPGDLPGTGSDFSGGVPWVVLLLLLGAAMTLGMGRLSNKPTI